MNSEIVFYKGLEEFILEYNRIIQFIKDNESEIINEGFDKAISPEEDYIINNPELEIAKLLFKENNKEAEKIAKYLCIMCDINNIDVDISYH